MGDKVAQPIGLSPAISQDALISAAADKILKSEYLNDKKVLLSNPGYAMTDIYYSMMNTTLSLAEVTYNTGRFTQSLGSKTFGSTSQVVIPNDQLVSSMYLHLRLDNLGANIQLPRGWGYRAIDSLSFILGSTNVSQLQINSQSLFQRNMEECETEEKRSEVLTLGGEEILNTGSINDVSSAHAYILLNLPFSRMQGLIPKLPLDSTLLNSVITVQVQFAQKSAFMGGSGATTYGNDFAVASILLRQGIMYDKEMSIRRDLRSNSMAHYTYPFIHAQSFIPQIFAGQVASPVTITLQSFINADLLCISLGVVQQSYLTSSSGSAVNPFVYDRLKDVVLKYNGVVMYNAEEELYRLYNLNSQFGSGKILNSFCSTPSASSPVDTYIIRFDFTRIKTLIYENQFQNVWRVPNNVMTIEFRTTTSNNYVMFATYYYNGVAEIKSDGQSDIYFS